MLNTETIAYEFQMWLEKHPGRAESALEALTALQHQAETLPMRQIEAFTDLQNLLARFMERD